MSTSAARQYNFNTDYLNGVAISDIKVDGELDSLITHINRKVLVASSAPSTGDGYTWIDIALDPLLPKVYEDTHSVWITLGWMRPDNLLKNGSFEFKSSSTATDPPEGWTLLATPSDIAVGATDSSEEGTNKVQVTTNAVNEGIQQTLSGLKPSTVYAVVVRAKVNVGTMTATLDTTGATTNASQTTTNTSFVTLADSFKTDASGTDVVVRLYGAASGDIVHFDSAAVYEVPAERVFSPHPNDLHVQGYQYQNTSGSNQTWGLFRLQCGEHTLSGGTRAITFPTAYKTLLGIWLQSKTADEMHPTAISATGFTANGTGTDGFYWTAMGIPA